ncbi:MULTISPECIES: ParB/RepB/Spo0J family partition protein [Yersinia]|uniref:ParB/RepB/Spo0J family partition protein n=1 Tax=Yersinia TaxID=629 RepID=UPI0005E217E7|nr:MULTISPECIES: ParB/RepB/Spo0J family partition protein [Yersinia]MBW5835513.1 ParB/RepB/Spo0J family partition protein [Yersinia enterocolitica]CNL76064.1 Chromosome-partitioning protein parB [Yersinia enterocolitica]
MAKNFKKQLSARNQEKTQAAAVPGIQENLINRDSVTPPLAVAGHSLLSEISRPEIAPAGQIIRVRLDEVYSIEQVRPDEDFEEETLKGMEETYDEVGMLTPPRVFPRDKNGYRIWFGETRIRSARRHGDEYIDVYVGLPPKNDKVRLLGQLIENLHQSGLKPLATANAMLELKNKWNMNGEQIAKSLGKPVSFVSKHMRLCDAPAVIRDLLKDKITGDVDLVYTLCQIHDRSPVIAEQLAQTARTKTLTRQVAKAELAKLKNRKTPTDIEQKNKTAVNTPSVETKEKTSPNNEPTAPPTETLRKEEASSAFNEARTSEAKASSSAAAASQKENRLIVRVDGQIGYLLINKMAEEYGHVWVKLEIGELCVEAKSVALVGIKEA